jgi:hypothetical protein
VRKLLGLGYSNLGVVVSGIPSVTAKFRPVPEALGGLALNLFVERDLVGSVDAVIEGIELESAITVSNGGPLPVYIPVLTHRVRLNREPIGRIIETSSFWLGAGSEREIVVDLFIATPEIPPAALGVVANGGRLEIAIDSRFRKGLLKIERTTEVGIDLEGVLRGLLD